MIIISLISENEPNQTSQPDMKWLKCTSQCVFFRIKKSSPTNMTFTSNLANMKVQTKNAPKSKKIKIETIIQLY